MSNCKDYLRRKQDGFTPRTAMEEAARCLLCYDAPCSKGCPAGTDPAKFIRSIRFRNVKGAAETIRENNVLGSVCAEVCPYDRLCEQACSRCGIDRPIEIGRLQRFAMEQEKLYGMQTLRRGPDNGKKVACIGAGPASLSAAAELARSGCDVTVYEAREKAGGWLSYGITPARLPQEVVDYDISKIAGLGVTFVCGTAVGRDISFAQLQKDYDAIFVGIGLSRAKLPQLPGVDLPGVYGGVDFLARARSSGGSFYPGRRVVVIGGGDVAMDCASTAQLLGAEKTAIWYRRSLNEAPADAAEIAYVTSLGVGITTDMAPVAVEGDGRVERIRFRGRDGESEACIACDTVVFAVGQTNTALELPALAADDKGLLRTECGKTNLAGVYAAGDIVNGGKTVVEAVAAGKRAARQIIADLAERIGE